MRWECPGSWPQWGGKFDTASCNQLWICCILLHQEGVWGCFRVCDVLWHLLICLSCECSVDVAIQGWRGFTAESVECEGGWVFTPDQRLYHTPKLLILPCGGVWANLASADGLWAMASLTPNPAKAVFQNCCWVWLSPGCLLLPQPCLLLPGPEIIQQSCQLSYSVLSFLRCF